MRHPAKNNWSYIGSHEILVFDIQQKTIRVTLEVVRFWYEASSKIIGFTLEIVQLSPRLDVRELLSF